MTQTTSSLLFLCNCLSGNEKLFMWLDIIERKQMLKPVMFTLITPTISKV